MSEGVFIMTLVGIVVLSLVLAVFLMPRGGRGPG